MSTDKYPMMAGIILEEEIELSLSDLCRSCRVDTDFVVALIQEGVIDPLEPAARRWTFGGQSLTRLRRAVNLHQDLGLNLAGIALALELLEDRERLRAELARRQKGFPEHGKAGSLD